MCKWSLPYLTCLVLTDHFSLTQSHSQMKKSNNPTNKKLKPIKLILHSGNEIPNADYFLATTHDIESGTELKIGVEASITNVTSNFAAMVSKKSDLKFA